MFIHINAKLKRNDWVSYKQTRKGNPAAIFVDVRVLVAWGCWFALNPAPRLEWQRVWQPCGVHNKGKSLQLYCYCTPAWRLWRHLQTKNRYFTVATLLSLYQLFSLFTLLRLPRGQNELFVNHPSLISSGPNQLSANNTATIPNKVGKEIQNKLEKYHI